LKGNGAQFQIDVNRLTLLIEMLIFCGLYRFRQVVKEALPGWRRLGGREHSEKPSAGVFDQLLARLAACMVGFNRSQHVGEVGLQARSIGRVR
jgi:hypothetical protein